MLEFLNLSVFACCTLYFFTALVFTLCILSFSGKRSSKLLFFIPFFANYRQDQDKVRARSRNGSRKGQGKVKAKSGKCQDHIEQLFIFYVWPPPLPSPVICHHSVIFWHTPPPQSDHVVYVKPLILIIKHWLLNSAPSSDQRHLTESHHANFLLESLYHDLETVFLTIS